VSPVGLLISGKSSSTIDSIASTKPPDVSLDPGASVEVILDASYVPVPS
jgi:hypothetical protein